MTRRSLTAKQREESYVVGSIIWFADGTMATQRLAKGDKAACEAFAETAQHPLQPGDTLDPKRPARMLVTTSADWQAMVADCFMLDGETRQ